MDTGAASVVSCHTAAVRRTRYRLGTHITGQIDAGEYAGNVLFIPRIPLSTLDVLETTGSVNGRPVSFSDKLSLKDAGLPFTLPAVFSTSSVRHV